jgi:hypothetical protein
VVVVETQTVTCEINLELYIFRFFMERCVRDRMLVGFLSTYAIGAYQHLSCEFEGQIHRKVHLMYPYIITFVSDRPVGFLSGRFYWRERSREESPAPLYSTDMWRRERSKEEESPAPLYGTDMWRREKSKEEESPAALYSTDM